MIRIGREIQCLPYAGFFFFRYEPQISIFFKPNYSSVLTISYGTYNCLALLTSTPSSFNIKSKMLVLLSTWSPVGDTIFFTLQPTNFNCSGILAFYDFGERISISLLLRAWCLIFDCTFGPIVKICRISNIRLSYRSLFEGITLYFFHHLKLPIL